MSEYLSEITPDMVKTVDKLKSTNFEGATPEEIEIYSEFNRLTALHSEELAQRVKIHKQEADERRALFKAQADSAINALDSLAALAQAKLKAVENGEA